MYRLAKAVGVGGLVRNDRHGVWLEIEGSQEAVAQFIKALPRAAPPSARIESVATWEKEVRGDRDLVIAASTDDHSTPATASIPPDSGPCAACTGELVDGADRRHGYAFINCTECGPRFTIVSKLPYDRRQTSMEPFVLCALCRKEYEDPGDRRFHAEPNACPACGPRVTFSMSGRTQMGPEAVRAAARALDDGRIVAIKGAGGFALAADARNPAAVHRLRARKNRPRKPLAVMARNLAEAEAVIVIDAAARAALESPARPIVIAPMRAGGGLAPEIAPGLTDVGVMLPPTPLQHLVAASGPPLLVMTSGNRRDEPIAIDGDDARCRLAGIADGFLDHDRAILARADDSVVRAIGGRAVPVRRARGFVPEAIAVPFASDPVLAVGAERNAAVCVLRDGQAVLSQHLGVLANADTSAFFDGAIDHLKSLFDVDPRLVAHDLHPDYRSTRWAEACGIERVAVQHHHAHIAACMIDNARTDPVLGVALDGSGYGPDGTMWGGEILAADLSGLARLGHLRPLALAGGAAAIAAPWKLALAALVDAGESDDVLAGVDARSRASVAAVLGGRQCVMATGGGRWFDAISALLGLCHHSTYDGQAAIELEARCVTEIVPAYPVTIAGVPMQWDTRPMIRAIAADVRANIAPEIIAARFHETFAHAVASMCRLARDDGAPATVALGGGCFCNRRLSERIETLLAEAGFEVLVCRRIPPGDGGIALGQAAIAGWRKRS